MPAVAPASAAARQCFAEAASRSGERHWLRASFIATFSSKISLRARNFNSERLKVNDKRGNPVEIAAVGLSGASRETAKAAFEWTIRELRPHPERVGPPHIASLYGPMTAGRNLRPTFAARAREVAVAMKQDCRNGSTRRTAVVIEEARLTHLA